MISGLSLARRGAAGKREREKASLCHIQSLLHEQQSFRILSSIFTGSDPCDDESSPPICLKRCISYDTTFSRRRVDLSKFIPKKKLMENVFHFSSSSVPSTGRKIYIHNLFLHQGQQVWGCDQDLVKRNGFVPQIAGSPFTPWLLLLPSPRLCCFS